VVLEIPVTMVWLEVTARTRCLWVELRQLAAEPMVEPSGIGQETHLMMEKMVVTVATEIKLRVLWRLPQAILGRSL
jgi:hypothetical protein